MEITVRGGNTGPRSTYPNHKYEENIWRIVIYIYIYAHIIYTVFQSSIEYMFVVHPIGTLLFVNDFENAQGQR